MDTIQTHLDDLVRTSQHYGWAVARGNQAEADALLRKIRELKLLIAQTVIDSNGQAYSAGIDDASRQRPLKACQGRSQADFAAAVL